MPIEKKPGLFYEILVRGICDDPARLGEFSGAHLIEAEAYVDTEGGPDGAGEVLQYKPGAAQDLPRDKVVAYLGDRFVTFEAQIRDLKQKLAAADTAAQSAATATAGQIAAFDAKLAERDAAIAERDVAIAQLTAARDQAEARISAVQSALAAAPSTPAA
jgi:hypothetical protein